MSFPEKNEDFSIKFNSISYRKLKKEISSKSVNEVTVPFSFSTSTKVLSLFCLFSQQMDPAKQAKVIREFQKQSAQMDMTVRYFIL